MVDHYNNILVIVSRITKKNKKIIIITFVVDGLSHNGITIGFFNFSHLSSTLQWSSLFSFVFCDFVYQIKMMIDVSLRVLFIYLFLHLFIIFFINLGYGHWVDLLITFVFLSLGFSSSIQRLEISKKKKKRKEFSIIVHDLQYRYEIEILKDPKIWIRKISLKQRSQ